MHEVDNEPDKLVTKGYAILFILYQLPLVREKSGKFKVREKSGNFKKSQGNMCLITLQIIISGIPFGRV